MNTISSSATRTAREQRWVNEQALFNASGLTAREFCKRHSISPSTFYKRRSSIRELGDYLPYVAPPELPHTAGFIDAGLLATSKGVKSTAAPFIFNDEASATSLELRIDLGAGVVLTLTARR